MGLESLLRVPHFVERLMFGHTSEENTDLWLHWRRHPIEKFAYSSVGILTAAALLAAAITYNRLAYNHAEQAGPQVQYELEHDSAILQSATSRDTGYGRIPDK